MSTWILDAGDHIQDQIQEYTRAYDLAESYKNYDEEDGILSRDRKIFVPDDDNLQMEIVHLHHDIPLAGHPGQEKTLELLERSYFWPGLTTYVVTLGPGRDEHRPSEAKGSSHTGLLVTRTWDFLTRVKGSR